MGEAENIYFTCLKSVLKFLFPIFERKELFLVLKSSQNGERSKNPPHLLRRCQVQKTHPAQGHAVQERQGFAPGPRQAALRSQAEGIRRSDQAHLQKEGQDDEEDRAPTRVHRLQAQGSSHHQEMQAFRTRRRKEEEGPDAPVLNWTFRDDAAAVFGIIVLYLTCRVGLLSSS